MSAAVKPCCRLNTDITDMAEQPIGLPRNINALGRHHLVHLVLMGTMFPNITYDEVPGILFKIGSESIKRAASRLGN